MIQPSSRIRTSTCATRKSGSVHEYRHEFAKRAARVNNWPEHCLLGVFLSCLKDESKVDVCIHKPRTVYKAMSLALEFQAKTCPTRGSQGPNWTFQISPLREHLFLVTSLFCNRLPRQICELPLLQIKS